MKWRYGYDLLPLAHPLQSISTLSTIAIPHCGNFANSIISICCSTSRKASVQLWRLIPDTPHDLLRFPLEAISHSGIATLPDAPRRLPLSYNELFIALLHCLFVGLTYCLLAVSSLLLLPNKVVLSLNSRQQLRLQRR